ncbi:hypothetical protein ORJ04_07050 [Rheinheimera baltica]|uniref:Mobile element protein n=1 Tax=Rheinheimera baltica TaxID=67576 RepID=A0ABT9HX43_9GAMM|nr:hypothetical protein [Rheinheimera baltica]MDP5135702.1 hypothetical protein [Rheinheimera baltica]
MSVQFLSDEQAIAILRIWRDAGHNLTTLAKFKTDDASKTILLMLLGYVCNNWYQVGLPWADFKDAMSHLGGLLDIVVLH